jgi:hypothetical protein
VFTIVSAAALATGLMAAPASATSYSGCGSHSCGGVGNITYEPLGPDWVITLQNPIVTDTRENDGWTPFLQVTYTIGSGAKHSLYLWGDDDGESAYFSDQDLFDVRKTIHIKVCSNDFSGGSPSCTQIK